MTGDRKRIARSALHDFLQGDSHALDRERLFRQQMALGVGEAGCRGLLLGALCILVGIGLIVYSLL